MLRSKKLKVENRNIDKLIDVDKNLWWEYTYSHHKSLKKGFSENIVTNVYEFEI